MCVQSLTDSDSIARLHLAVSESGMPGRGSCAGIANLRPGGSATVRDHIRGGFAGGVPAATETIRSHEFRLLELPRTPLRRSAPCRQATGGHRWFLESGWCSQPDVTGESSMTTAKPLARTALWGALASYFAAAELHHHQGRDLRKAASPP